MPTNNTCSEVALETAFAHAKTPIRFNTAKVKNDDQIDLGSAYPVDETPGIEIIDNHQKDFLAILNGLDKKMVYMMRTGERDKGGHFQALRYINERWQSYSTPTNQFYLTNQNETLNDDGAERLLGGANERPWQESGHMIQLTPLTPKRMIAAANYVIAYRTTEGTKKEREDAGIAAVSSPESENNTKLIDKAGYCTFIDQDSVEHDYCRLITSLLITAAKCLANGGIILVNALIAGFNLTQSEANKATSIDLYEVSHTHRHSP